MFSYYNPNPRGKNTGDCVIRALTKATGKGWYRIYAELCVYGFYMADWGDSNAVWGNWLISNGFKRGTVPNTCPACYTFAEFCKDNSSGTFVLATGKHVACVVDGVLYDSWNSLGETVAYYFYK